MGSNRAAISSLRARRRAAELTESAGIILSERPIESVLEGIFIASLKDEAANQNPEKTNTDPLTPNIKDIFKLIL